MAMKRHSSLFRVPGGKRHSQMLFSVYFQDTTLVVGGGSYYSAEGTLHIFFSARLTEQDVKTNYSQFEKKKKFWSQFW